MRPGLVWPIILTVAGALGTDARAEGLIAGVSVSPPFFNPSVGQKEAITFELAGMGDVTVSVLDRDLIPIRTLPVLKGAGGHVRAEWDGRDDRKRIVPDEAYTVQIVLCNSGKTLETYSPAVGFRPTLSEPKRTYSVVSGVLRYELEDPSRMHIQAGEAVPVGNEGKRDGPVLRTIVDRAPRTAGAVVEIWNGFDESGTVHIPSLKNFVLSILGESLPPSAFIAVGNHLESFRQYARSHRQGAHSLVEGAEKPQNDARGHHQGLTALEDFCPALTLNVAGKKDGVGRVEVNSKQLAAKVAMSPEDAKYFIRPDGVLMIFVDEKPVLRLPGASSPASLNVPAESLPLGEHRLAANWVSGYGPVAVQVARIVRLASTKEAAK